MKYIFWVIKGDVLNLLNYLHLESKHVHIFLFGLKIHKNVLYLQLDESNKKVFDGCLSQHKTDSSCFVSRDKALITACAFYSIKKASLAEMAICHDKWNLVSKTSNFLQSQTINN